MKNGFKYQLLTVLQTLTEQFRLSYGRFWQNILNVDVEGIKEESQKLGVGELYGLFACMATGRSWNSITKGIDKNTITNNEVKLCHFHYHSMITKIFFI